MGAATKRTRASTSSLRNSDYPKNKPPASKPSWPKHARKANVIRSVARATKDRVPKAVSNTDRNRSTDPTTDNPVSPANLKVLRNAVNPRDLRLRSALPDKVSLLRSKVANKDKVVSKAIRKPNKAILKATSRTTLREPR